jgi:glycogen operon protein
LNDLVSYDRKHNEANGENNRDGADDNRSWNCGAEGPTDDPRIEALRGRQVKNFMTVTLLSLGMPMILMGDEVRRTQDGNNNAYCHDNEGNWFDWTLVAKHADIHRFVRLLIARRSLRELEDGRRALSLTEMLHEATTAWHGVRLLQPDWSAHSHSLALGAELRRAGVGLHMIMNAYWEPLDFELPHETAKEPWRRWIDTSLDTPEDIMDWKTAPVLAEQHLYHAGPRSVVVLWRRSRPEARSLT